VPSATTDFDAGLHELRKVLDDLDSRFAAAFSALKSRKLCFSTGDYAYLNAHYELEGSYVPLAEANVAQAVRLLREANCEQLFTQSGTDTALTGSLAEAGIDWQVFDTGAAKPAAGNYVDVMEANLDRLRK
jgi:ABC-type Zn uptake system ZnuABC Zn-binding protein ZnuA